MKVRFLRKYILIQLLLLPFCLSAQPETARLKITYIANEGVLIEAAGKKVLIDAHHYHGNPHYLPVPSTTLEKMIGGFKPFDGVDLILATHVHNDHFDAESVGRELFNNKKVKFLASEQITGDLESNYKDFPQIKNQVVTVTPEVGFTRETEVNGIPVKLLGMKHASEQFKSIQNIGYILKLGKYKVLHVGDADGTIANFEPFKLPNEGIDVAIVPYWFLTYKPFNKILNKYIQAGRIIATHIPPEEVVDIEKKALSNYPNAILFLALGQEMTL